MKRWFVSGEIRMRGTSGPFLPAWRAVDAHTSDHAAIEYASHYERSYEIDKVYPPQFLGEVPDEAEEGATTAAVLHNLPGDHDERGGVRAVQRDYEGTGGNPQPGGPAA